MLCTAMVRNEIVGIAKVRKARTPSSVATRTRPRGMPFSAEASAALRRFWPGDMPPPKAWWGAGVGGGGGGGGWGWGVGLGLGMGWKARVGLELGRGWGSS